MSGMKLNKLFISYRRLKTQRHSVSIALYKLLMPSFFFKKMFCLMSALKFTLSDVTSFLTDNLSGLKKSYIQA